MTLPLDRIRGSIPPLFTPFRNGKVDAAAKKLGLIESNEHRLPMVPATPELEKRLDAVLARANFA
jgi:4-hydroxy-tetrahydrodipicolinate synthase